MHELLPTLGVGGTRGRTLLFRLAQAAIARTRRPAPLLDKTRILRRWRTGQRPRRPAHSRDES
jgi:hypothetical protein